MTNRSVARSSHCSCKCHQEPKQVHCCTCYTKGYSDCRCGQEKRCCGEPQHPNRPDTPKAPGWEPGDRPAQNPLARVNGFDDRKNAFDQAVREIMRESGSVKGPHFGQRKDEYLPFLLLRADAGDRGKRALNIPFWESPDIFVAPDLRAADAPDTPTNLGGVARADVPNTLWAHVWNLGRSPVYNARVEFYWFNPALSFSQESANLIGVTYVDLGNRESGRAHRIVKCPETWVPTFVNNGHECLVVRCYEPLTDPLSATPWDARNDRHVGQRNIAVINASSPAQLEMRLRLGCGASPGNAQLLVQEVEVAGFNWLAILESKREHGYRQAKNVQRVAGFTYPTLVRSGIGYGTLGEVDPSALSRLLNQKLTFERGCDELEVLYYVNVDGLQPKECAIFRIMQMAGEEIVGGYTVVARRL